MYVCSSPFQIITAIILATENNETADIYINSSFKHVEKYVERLRSSEIFNNVSVIPYNLYVRYFNKSGRVASKAQSLANYMFPSRLAKCFISQDCFYRKIYSANRDILCRYVLFHHYKYNVNAELILYEEGNSAYLNDVVLREHPIEKILRCLLYGKKAITSNTLLLYSPELFYKIKKQSTFKVKEINVSALAVEKVRDVFCCIDSLPKNSAIIIDTHKSAIFDSAGKEKLEVIYRTIVDSMNTDVFLKRHPRECDTMFEREQLIDESIPFEVLCTDASADSFILISYLSTAVATPKLMFDKEPYVLLLYNLVDSNLETTHLRLYYDSLRKMYKYPQRVLIPKTMAELQENLQLLSLELSQRYVPR